MSIKQKVLVPVDFSVKALDAVRSARDLALETTEVTLIHVMD